MKLVPLSDRVVLKQCEAEETTKSGIILTSSAQEKPQEAEVIAVGPGGMVDGKEVTMQVKAGQKVIYSKYAGTDVKLDGEEYIIVKQNDILAVVDIHLPFYTIQIDTSYMFYVKKYSLKCQDNKDVCGETLLLY